MTDRTFRKLDSFRSAGLIAAGVIVLILPFFTGLINAPLLLGQSSSTRRFESVSVRVCEDLPSTKRGRGYSSSGGVLRTGCMPLADENGLGLIQRAYSRFSGSHTTSWPAVTPVKGRPTWFDSALFEIVGTAAPGTAQETMEGPMMRAVLEDKFKLRIHEESAEVLIYTLTADLGTQKLSPFVEGSCRTTPATFPMPQLPHGQRYCQVRAGMRPPGVVAEGVNLSDFTKLLSVVLDRSVVDRTGIAGRFNINLEFAPDASTPRYLAGGELARFATAPAFGTPTLAGALERLGLRLEPGAGSQKRLIIEHVEKPQVD